MRCYDCDSRSRTKESLSRRSARTRRSVKVRLQLFERRVPFRPRATRLTNVREGTRRKSTLPFCRTVWPGKRNIDFPKLDEFLPRGENFIKPPPPFLLLPAPTAAVAVAPRDPSEELFPERNPQRTTQIILYVLLPARSTGISFRRYKTSRFASEDSPKTEPRTSFAARGHFIQFKK